MAQYKSPIGGSGKRTTNLFYRSGINSLISRIEKIENEVFCCKDTEKITSLAGSHILDRDTYNYDTILWDGSTNDDLITLWYPTKGDKFDIILSAAVHASGSNITSTNQTALLYGSISLSDSNASTDVTLTHRVLSSATLADSDFINLDSNGTATGGEQGNWLSFLATADGEWMVRGVLSTTGTPASVAIFAAAAA